MSSLNTIAAFLFVLGVLRVRARAWALPDGAPIGVRVLTFSLGFGPKLLKTKRGGTEYCVSRFRWAATSRWPARTRTTRAPAVR